VAAAAEMEIGYEYDPAKLEAFFEARPVLVARRAAMVRVV
jgi:hypothetical protein